MLYAIAWKRKWTAARDASDRPGRQPPGNGKLILFALGVGLITFCIRIALPIGWSLKWLGLQLPFFPQYIALFAGGILAQRGNWLAAISERTGKQWQLALIALLLLWPPWLFFFGGGGRSLAPFLGGLHWQNLAYSVWEQFVCMAMIITLLRWFGTSFNRQGTLARKLSASAYTVYIIHPPVLVSVSLLLQGLVLSPVVKFALVTPVALIACFVLGNTIRQLPLARKIL